jgi:predicted MPP superfamily phosphohydrolase
MLVPEVCNVFTQSPMSTEADMLSSLPVLTWLHLSDLHICEQKTGWDAKRVTDTLCEDLKTMQKEHGLRPDLIFFTGDAAYGHLGDREGKSITEQFSDAHDFFTSVREAFEPAIEQRNLFLVPGNHDVNRSRITASQKEWLLNDKRKLTDIEDFILVVQKTPEEVAEHR